jgi:hypothetical protein
MEPKKASAASRLCLSYLQRPAEWVAPNFRVVHDFSTKRDA